jgi:hypothetical protein
MTSVARSVSRRVSASLSTLTRPGWTVGYLRGMGGGDLLTGFELGDTARGCHAAPSLSFRRAHRLFIAFGREST